MTVEKQLIDKVESIRTTLNEISVYNLDVKTSLELYYELARKVNEVINELSRFEGIVSDEVVKQNETLNYLLGEGLTNKVVERVNELITNGTINDLINNKIFNELNTKIETYKQQTEEQIITKASIQEVDIERKRIDSFTSLTQGSTTGDAELIDARIGADGKTYSNIGNAIREQFKKLDSKFESNNLLNQSILKLNHVCNQNGVFVTTQGYNCFSDIPVKANIKYNVSPTARFIVLVNSEKTFVSASGSSTTDADLSFTPTVDGYVHITYISSETYNAKMYIDGTDANNVLPYNQSFLSDSVKIRNNGVTEIIDEKIKSDVYSTDNLLTNAEFYENKAFNQYLKTVSSNTYSYYKVKIYKGETYVVSPRARFIIITDYNNIKQSNSFEDEVFTETSFTVLSDGYAYVTYYNTDLKNAFMYVEESDNVQETGYYKLNKNILVTKDNIDSSVNLIPSNVLANKKWVSCGDSFTHGDFTGFVDENGLSGEESPYLYDKEWGMYKTYPYQIAKRNGMSLINEAVNGSTMTYNSSYYQPFSYERYKNIPSDTDYITIKIGINDDNKKAQVGTIDDTTNETFYGAWNIVLEYLITNYPFTKIGVIVTNGSSPSYTEATRKVCRKWGIPYLDLELDYQVPLTFRVNEKTEVIQKVRDIRMNNFRVSTTNWHPNIKCHEYESTFIENFLRSL